MAVPIVLDALTKRFADGTTAVDDLSLSIEGGEVCVLLGPSGCGKTTTLRMVNRLVEPTAGTVHIGGADHSTVDPVTLRRGIGYVIQGVGLFPHQTVEANVACVPRLLGWDRRRIATRVEEMLDLVGLDPGRFARRYPRQLSGGQQQRVGVARALAADPPVLLMDEPFAAVDPVTRRALQDTFLTVKGRLDTTVVLVTHDLDEALRLGDRIAVLSDGGRLHQVDTPLEVLDHPADGFVESFVGPERAVRRLRLVPLDTTTLRDGPAPAGSPTLSAPATVADALAAALGSPTGALAVLRTDGSHAGWLTLADLGNHPDEP